jgi:DNA helicase-2/ATP-dependent DNA helicase PcrA
MKAISKLNPQQQEAVLHTEGPLLILAGAGSGKTGTMTHRIAHLIMDNGVSPWNILAVTFTNKAAGEMRERVEALVSGGARGMWIMTFHALCLRILRAHTSEAGYKNDFVIYDPTDQKVVVKAAVKSLGLDDKKFSPNYVLSVISDCKGRGQRAADFEGAGTDTYLHRSLADVYKLYEATLKRNNAMDFDDLIVNAVALLEHHKDIRDEYVSRFKYIMVDEYQDTDQMQYRLIKLLTGEHRNLCVVGDDDQCIYQWRGADISNILGFEHDFKSTKVIKLEQNYRSNANILNGANAVIGNNPSRKDKKLWTALPDGDLIHFESTYDEKEEARYIAREISKGTDEGRDFRDFAILYRTNAQSRTFEEAFSAAHIPYRVLGGVRYYDRKEIKDMLSYMRLALNRADDVSLTRIINEPKRGIGAVTLARITAFATSRGESLFDMLTEDDVLGSLSARARAGVVELVAAVLKYSVADVTGSEVPQATVPAYKISEIYDGLMVETGYLEALEEQNTVEADGRIENLLEFKSVILDYENEDNNITLAEFLEKVTLIADIDNHDSSENAVTLMTLHSAKGLEFPVVFMPGLEDGLFPSARSLENPGGVEEERRLCYVGMTRAMEKLYLTRAKARTMYGRWDRTLESRFLKEIDKEYLEGADQLGGETTGFFHEAMGADDGFKSAEIFRPFDQLAGIKRSARQGSSGGRAGRASMDGAPTPPQSIGAGSGVYDPAGASGAAGQKTALALKSGDKVRHAKFGEGVVLETDPRIVTVIFGSVGKKKLAADVAPLEKV